MNKYEDRIAMQKINTRQVVKVNQSSYREVAYKANTLQGSEWHG